MKKIGAGESAVEKMYPLSADESLRRHLVLAMKHTELNIKKFNSFYPEGVRPLDRFETALEALEDLGIITRNDESIRYLPEYADLADRFVRLFYSDEANGRIRGERRQDLQLAKRDASSPIQSSPAARSTATRSSSNVPVASPTSPPRSRSCPNWP